MTLKKGTTSICAASCSKAHSFPSVPWGCPLAFQGPGARGAGLVGLASHTHPSDFFLPPVHHPHHFNSNWLRGVDHMTPYGPL